MRYLLDTNVVSALVKNQPGVRSRLRDTTPDQIALSSIVLHELFFGAYRGRRTAKTLAQVDGLPFGRRNPRRSHLPARRSAPTTS